MVKAPRIILLRIGIITFAVLMGEAQTPHFDDPGISGRVPEPQNKSYSSFETPGHLKEIKNIPGSISKNNIFANIKMLETHV